MPAPFPRGRRTEPTTEPGPLRSSAQANAEVSRDPDVRHARQSYRRNLPPCPSSTRVWDGAPRRNFPRARSCRSKELSSNSGRRADFSHPRVAPSGCPSPGGRAVPWRASGWRPRRKRTRVSDVRSRPAWGGNPPRSGPRWPRGSRRPGRGSAPLEARRRAGRPWRGSSSMSCRAAGSSASRDAMAVCSRFVLNLAQRVGRQARIVEIVRHDGPPFRIGPGRPGSRRRQVGREWSSTPCGSGNRHWRRCAR